MPSLVLRRKAAAHFLKKLTEDGFLAGKSDLSRQVFKSLPPRLAGRQITRANLFDSLYFALADAKGPFKRPADKDEFDVYIAGLRRTYCNEGWQKALVTVEGATQFRDTVESHANKELKGDYAARGKEFNALLFDAEEALREAAIAAVVTYQFEGRGSAKEKRNNSKS